MAKLVQIEMFSLGFYCSKETAQKRNGMNQTVKIFLKFTPKRENGNSVRETFLNLDCMCQIFWCLSQTTCAIALFTEYYLLDLSEVLDIGKLSLTGSGQANRAFVTKTGQRFESEIPGQFGGRWQHAVTRIVTPSELLSSYM